MGIKVDVDQFWKDGYQIIKGVFSPTEVDQIRANAYTTLQESQKQNLVQTSDLYPGIRYVVGDLLGKPLLAPVLLDSRMIDIAKRLLGPKVVYFGNSNLQFGAGTNDFHKDNLPQSRLNPNTPDSQENPYTLIRFGIYLQDHKHHSGGLKVRRGSNWYANYTQGPVVCIDSEPGDVVIWTMRTTHSGHTARFRLAPSVGLSSRIQIRFPKLAHLISVPEEKERVALFMSYAAPDHHLERYLEFLKTREDYLTAARVSNYSVLAQSQKPEGLEFRLHQ